MSDNNKVRTRLLAFVVLVLAVTGLTISFPVSMPLTVTVFVIASGWPVKPRFDRKLPSTPSYCATILLLLPLGGFAGAMRYCLSEVVRSLLDQFMQLQQRAVDSCRRRSMR